MKTSSFKKWQTDRQGERLELVNQFLSSLARGRTRVLYVSDLASMVAAYVQEKQGRPCSRSTLLRNRLYKARLLAYMADRDGRGTDRGAKMYRGDPRTQAILQTYELEFQNCRRENERLKLYIARGSAPISGGADDCVSDFGRNVARKQSRDLEIERLKYISTCEALWVVINALGGIIAIRMDEGVVDCSECPPKILVGKSQAAAFLEWIKMRNPSWSSTLSSASSTPLRR